MAVIYDLTKRTGTKEKKLTKLVDVTVTEEIAYIDVPITDAIANCRDFYYKTDGVTFTNDNWVDIKINNLLCWFATKATVHGSYVGRISLPLMGNNSIDSKNINEAAAIWNLSVQGTRTFPSTVTAVRFLPHQSTVNITAGRFQLWGMI